MHGTFESLSNNYTTDFPEDVEIENQEEYMKTMREDGQTTTMIAIMLLMTKLMT